MNILCYKTRPNIHGSSKRLLSSSSHDMLSLFYGRKNSMFQEASVFDSCNLNNVKVYLNSDFYSYDDLNLNFENFKKRYAILFNMYTRFRKTYYGIDCFETLLNVLSFVEKGPFAIIDCSRQNESVKNVTVNVRTEFDCKENVLVNTTAYFLIIHDRIVQYSYTFA